MCARQTIDFEMNNRTIYRNTLALQLPSTWALKNVCLQASTSQLCSVDIITVLHPSAGGSLSQGASCGLGKFQKMEKVKKAWIIAALA
jgi:hypothetical protein